MIKFILIFNNSGKLRIVRFYDILPESERLATQNDVSSLCLSYSKQVLKTVYIYIYMYIRSGKQSIIFFFNTLFKFALFSAIDGDF